MLAFGSFRSARRQRATDFLVAGRDAQRDTEPESNRGACADEWKQPNDRGRDERRTQSRDNRCERTSRGIDIPKATRDKVLRLRKPNEHRCRRQRECE